jgi:hypothetical protein
LGPQGEAKVPTGTNSGELPGANHHCGMARYGRLNRRVGRSWLVALFSLTCPGSCLQRDAVHVRLSDHGVPSIWRLAMGSYEELPPLLHAHWQPGDNTRSKDKDPVKICDHGASQYQTKVLVNKAKLVRSEFSSRLTLAGI